MTHGISELQMSLLAIGVLSVGGVWGYNVWQERKHRKLAQEVFRSQQKDVLMRQTAEPAMAQAPEAAVAEGGERIEPVFIPPDSEQAQAAGAPDSVVFTDLAEPVEPLERPLAPREPSEPVAMAEPDGTPLLDADSVVLPAPQPQPAAAAQVPAQAAEPALDAALDSEPPPELADDIIDCIVHLNANDMISAPLFWAAQRQLLSRLAGRLCWSGLDENTGKWQRLHAHDANSYRRLVAALQLADRDGPIAADDLALYCDGVRQLAAHYQAQVIVPVVADVVTRARSLDEFCAAVDWRLSVNLVHRDGAGLPLDAIGQFAATAGLQKAPKGDDGYLHALDQHGQTQFTLGLLGGQAVGNAEQAERAAGVTLTIDVPRVADGLAAYDRMIHLARIMVGKLDAVLVDDQRMPLSDEVLAMIRGKIAEFQQKMAVHQIPAGGRRALRLYA